MSLPPRKLKATKARAPERTKSLGRTRKAGLIDDVQQLVDNHEHLFCFGVENMRTAPFKALRLEFREDGRFLLGKNQVLRVALGRSASEAYKPGLDAFASKLQGEVGVLFTNRPVAQVEAFFNSFRELDFARAGSRAAKTIDVQAGPLVGQPSSMVESLRNIQLPVGLKKGVVVLEQDHRICTEGDVLSAAQARALKFFGVKTSEFKVRVMYHWSNGVLDEM